MEADEVTYEAAMRACAAAEQWESTMVPRCDRLPVDGSEIRRSPVEIGGLSHYLQGF